MSDSNKNLLEAEGGLDSVEQRLRFIMDTLCPESDWIESSAATGLYCTIRSIANDIKTIKEVTLAKVQS